MLKSNRHKNIQASVKCTLKLSVYINRHVMNIMKTTHFIQSLYMKTCLRFMNAWKHNILMIRTIYFVQTRYISTSVNRHESTPRKRVIPLKYIYIEATKQ